MFDTKIRQLLALKKRTLFPSSKEKSGWETRIKVIFYGTALALFMFGFFMLFYRSFLYLANQPQIGSAITNRILSIGFLTFFSMLFVSNIITALSTLYRSPEITYLMTNPLTYIDIFTLKSIENIFFSSWAILILGGPIVIAYGMAYHAPFFFYPLVIMTLLIFIVIPSSLGIMVTVIFSRFIIRLRIRQVLLISAFIFVVGLAIFLTFIRPQVLIIEETEDFYEVNRFLASLPITSSYLSPSSWLTTIFNQAINLNLQEVIFYFLVLLSTTLAAFQINYWIGETFYFRSWTQSQEAKAIMAMELVKRRKIHHSKFWRWMPKLYRTLLDKDGLIFWRDPIQWSQLLILVILLIFYLLNLRNLPSKVNNVFWKTMISFFNSGFTAYVLATVAVRFVYPAISMEGRNFWIIGSAPIRLSTVFWAKFWQTFSIFFVSAEILVMVSSYLLKVEPIIYYVSFFGTIVMSLSLTAISLGMGAIFPYFKEKNPSKIASSAGGLVTMLISLVYVILMLVIMAQPIYQYFRSQYFNHHFSMAITYFSFAAVLIISLVISGGFIFFGLRAMENRDY